MLTVPPLPIGPLTTTVPVLAGVNVSVWVPDPILIASPTVSEPPATCETVRGVNISIPVLAPENADGLAELPPTVSAPMLPATVVILLLNVKFPPVTRLALVASRPSPRLTAPVGLPRGPTLPALFAPIETVPPLIFVPPLWELLPLLRLSVFAPWTTSSPLLPTMFPNQLISPPVVSTVAVPEMVVPTPPPLPMEIAVEPELPFVTVPLVILKLAELPEAPAYVTLPVSERVPVPLPLKVALVLVPSVRVEAATRPVVVKFTALLDPLLKAYAPPPELMPVIVKVPAATVVAPE